MVRATIDFLFKASSFAGFIFIASTLLSLPVFVIRRRLGRKAQFKGWMAGVAICTWLICFLALYFNVSDYVMEKTGLYDYLTLKQGMDENDVRGIPILLLLLLGVLLYAAYKALKLERRYQASKLGRGFDQEPDSTSFSEEDNTPLPEVPSDFLIKGVSNTLPRRPENKKSNSK